MLDFYTIGDEAPKKNLREVKPTFIIVSHSSDLMIKGRDFYAVWDEDSGLWSKDEGDLIRIIDRDLEEYKKKLSGETSDGIKVRYMRNASSGMIDIWHKYVQRQMRDSYKELDSKITFANTKTTKKDYASKRLPYDLLEGSFDAWEELVSTLYNEEEREKIEWSIGSIVAGDSKKIQKFVVFYGTAGSGKSTIMNIIEMLFDGYCNHFKAKELASANNQFALESFKDNPLASIDHDGDLSRIEDNTLLNSIVSHEKMEVNEKFKSKYTARFNTFLFIGSNKPVKITEAKSGIIRRLIDIRPSGRKIPFKKYTKLMEQIPFELGAIASHCLKVYKDRGVDYYDNYIPVDMIGSTNDFYDFVENNYDQFVKEDSITLKAAWELYKEYCDFANVQYPFSMRQVRVELENYFNEKKDEVWVDGNHLRNYYMGFKWDKFPTHEPPAKVEGSSDSGNGSSSWIFLKDASEFSEGSVFDRGYEGEPAQYAKEDGTPSEAWSKVKTKLMDIDTSKLHYVRVPENHIVIDFDLKDENGEKDLQKNLEAASGFKKTYCELSKSGAGLHLHYIYDGDVSKLSRVYGDNIEVKIFTGKSSLRRKLTKCNDLEVAHLNSGLPLKGEKNIVMNFDAMNLEAALETTIKKCLAKEVHADTTSNIDFIKKILDDAYASGKPYSIDPRLRQKVLIFANNSTNQSEKCVKTVGQMKWESDSAKEEIKEDGNASWTDDELIFFDVEVFINLFVLCWKIRGVNGVFKLINPTSKDLEPLIGKKLIGFNNRNYDNHILYARWAKGYSNEKLYDLSQRIISEKDRNAKFKAAYGLSYTDIYDFSSKKQGLKKWEIELGIHHLENEHPWDKPVDEKYWDEIAEYCANDVLATEAVFEARHEDFVAREVLADLAQIFTGSGTVNDTTNQLTTKIILRGDKDANKQFVYPDLSKEFPGYEFCATGIDRERYNPGTKIVNGKSLYMGEDPGEGGYVFADQGQYYNVWTFDVASMHPSSIKAENGFGRHTENFSQLLDIRLYIKHKEYDKVKTMFNGALAKYLTATDPEELKKQAKALSYALKIAINSVYGLTSASFDNPMRDPRNKDNWVAKRGALMMITLKNEVLKRGFKVIHCKTDSIKVVDPTPEIESFIYDFGKKYGYTFEIEAKYDRICLVNDAVYIAKESDWEGNDEPGKWTGTGAQFKEETSPYVFKTLFSKEPIEFKDMCETKSVETAMYLDMNEGLPEGEHNYKFVGKVGQFTPLIFGAGGGELLREKDGKYSAVTKTKGYRWLESEAVKELHLEDKIDRSYYRKQCDEAIENISNYGDFDEFVNGPSKSFLVTGKVQDDFMNIPEWADENGVPLDDAV